jgi:hypothetical protein
VIKLLFLAREQKNSGKKFFLFIEHEVLFYETPFLQRARRNDVCGAIRKKSAVVVGRVLNFGTKEGTNREADYMCFSPLRRKTSELEGEEYTSRIVSGIDRLDPPLVSSRFTRLCTTFGETGGSRWRHRSTNIRPM